MSDVAQVITDPRVGEKTTVRLRLQLTDQDGNDLLAGDLTAISLTLYELRTGTILNGRDTVSILNANGGTVSATGLVTMVLTDLDNALLFARRSSEDHVALIRWQWLNGTRSAWKQVQFTVVDQTTLT